MKGFSKLGKEEKLNTWTHAIGVPLFVVGLFVLLNRCHDSSSIAKISIWIYGVSLVSMFLVSALYHASTNTYYKSKLRIADHINIYILIAGTYTPLTLIILAHSNGWLLFYTVWTIAILGAMLKLFFTGKFETISLLLYIIMGWLIAFDITNLLKLISGLELVLLVLGGFFYTVGTYFYIKSARPYYHAIWHLFVLAGASAHFMFVYEIIR